MHAAGAPSSYILVNLAAIVAGFLAARLLKRSSAHKLHVAGICTIAVALALLGIALAGPRVNGASRWFRIAGISLQPSLMLLPPAMVVFAGNRYWLSSIGLMLAGVALALQPDRAMAGTLAAGLAVLRVCRSDVSVTVSLAVASCAFAVTLAASDHVPPAPFVEHVVHSAFAFNPLAGLGIVVGLAMMLVPAVIGVVTQTHDVAKFAVFGATWLTVIAFAVAGNYPTPLVGYGASGILGYGLSAALLTDRH